MGLPSIGSDDLCSGPVVSIRDQNQASEPITRQSVQRLLIEFVGEGQSAPCAAQIKLEHFAQVLATHQTRLDIAPKSRAVALLFAAPECVCELLEPLLGGRGMLQDPADLSGPQRF